MTREDLQVAYPIGCRVRLSAQARVNGVLTQAEPDGNYGTVVGHGRLFETLTIRRDNRRTVTTFHWHFWDRCDVEVPVSVPHIEEHW